MGKKILQMREGDKGLFSSLDKGVRFLRAVYIKSQSISIHCSVQRLIGLASSIGACRVTASTEKLKFQL